MQTIATSASRVKLGYNEYDENGAFVLYSKILAIIKFEISYNETNKTSKSSRELLKIT